MSSGSLSARSTAPARRRRDSPAAGPSPALAPASPVWTGSLAYRLGLLCCPVVNERSPTGGSIARRRLLLALGFGITNVAVLRRLGSGDAPGGEPTPDGATEPTAPESTGSTASAVVSESAPPSEPPPVPVVDESAARGTDQPFDLAIVGGRVIDPASGFDFVASIGVSGATVAAISPGPDPAPLQAATVIDATGLVVSPGFIDILSYSPNGYGEWFKLADGVTANLGMHGLDNYADRWFAAHPDGSSPVHFGGAYDNAFVRQARGLDPYEEADDATLRAVLEDARTDLRNGFVGLHMQPEYTPGTAAEDVLSHAALAAEHGVPLCVHARYSDNLPPGTNLQAVGELVHAARETGAHVHVEHINSTGGTGVMAEALGRISDAIDEGLSMTACTYPYEFWATYLRSARYDDWQQKYGIGYGDLQVVGTPDRLTEQTFDDAYAANLLTAAFAMSPEDVELPLQADFVMVGSDAILERPHNNHPRSTGCFSRVLGRYVRERGVLDLPTALSKMTIQPARLLEGRCPDLRRKGRLGIGADADITVFDPATVSDRSTIADPAQESEGIRWVVVEGRVARSPDGAFDHQPAGRGLRSDIGAV